jgi:DNA-directed RNA polymerase beta' subunit
VINRNNRLKRLLDLGAPEIIVNNGSEMLRRPSTRCSTTAAAARRHRSPQQAAEVAVRTC